MGNWIRLFSKKWLILGFLAALFPFFQNMSPTGDYVDIRELAPRKPAGDWDNPMATYFPKDIHGDSLSSVQQKVLSYNFDPILKDLEVTYLHGNRRRFAFGESEGQNSVDSEDGFGKWKVGLVNPTKLRFSYENQVAGQNLELVCEAQSGRDGMSLRMSRPISSQMHVGLTHETARRESQVQFDYSW
jgi:hypothetical protein